MAAEPPTHTHTALTGGAADYNGRTKTRFGGRFNAYREGLTNRWNVGEEVPAGTTKAGDIRDWDIAPPQEYFNELARVSKNQIIFGANYFGLPPTRCFVVWRKTNIPLEGFTMSPVEYAWTSFNRNAVMYECGSSFVANSGKEQRFHPTQKPVELYAWLYRTFAQKGDKILDTHLGSGSSRIAARMAGLDFVGCEIDKTYYALQEERFMRFSAQQTLLF